jgi:uncharacterized protein (DUF362 family)
MSPRLTRRELGTLAGLGALAAVRPARAAFTPTRVPGRVGVAALPPPSAGARLDPAAARRALEAALVAATGATSAADAARALFAASDTVGIKVNCLGGSNLSPRRELVEALVAVLGEAGVSPERVIVFERSSRELQRAGYPIRRAGSQYRCYGIDNDYEAEPSSSGEIGSCFARLVSRTCTALVSFGVVKDHDLAGVSAALKNLYGLIHNPNKYHDHNCDPYVADLLRHPYLVGSLRLAVLDGVTAQCHGGPAFRPDAVWPLGLVAASTDAVAADAWAWRVLDAERVRRGLPTLTDANRPPRFLGTASRLGLGVGDPRAVHEVRA